MTKMTNYEDEMEKEEADQKVLVRFMIKREDLEKQGFTKRCPGCKAILRGTARQGHSEQCRARLTEATKLEETVIKNDVRFNEFVAKRVGAEDAKRRRTPRSDGGIGRAAEGRVVRHRQAAMLILNVVTGPLKMEIPNKGGNQRGGRRKTLAKRTCRSTCQSWTSILRASHWISTSQTDLRRSLWKSHRRLEPRRYRS